MAVTIVTCWTTITFAFALHYARKDIEAGGLEFSGDNEPPLFADYVYLAVGCSATFGTTDTAIVTTAMRRTVSVHSVIAFFLNTVVVAVLLSVIVRLGERGPSPLGRAGRNAYGQGPRHDLGVQGREGALDVAVELVVLAPLDPGSTPSWPRGSRPGRPSAPAG